jgi:hypothetical protein
LNNDNEPSATDALQDYIKTTDVLPSARVNLIHRILTHIGPHGTPALWDAYINTTRKGEPHLYYEPPYSAEERAAKLRGMTAAQKLEYIHRHGGRK